ncbi:hypothetical protein LOD99_15302 [Oopsacas minuta]|uniref:Formin GTPase-binding domain-containing protein n=1 Tax=Oopsacas minuta TaxID=111878 RepID=A0AAV7KB78_9METZ|nr:hypothetical protein LOD99_15302 [Oopsacas minuta]
MSCYGGLFRRRSMTTKTKKRNKGPKKYPSHENINTDSSEVQDLIQEIDHMSPEKIRDLILQMLDEMDLPPPSKTAILNKGISEHKMLLKSSILKDHGTNSGQGRIPADEFVDQLKTNLSIEDMIPILEKLRVAVGTYHINWLHDFANKNGHVHLLNLMDHWNAVRPDESEFKVVLQMY